MATYRVKATTMTALLGRSRYATETGSAAAIARQGFSSAVRTRDIASESISMDGPCCQSARLAVDHAGVANAKITASAADQTGGKNKRPMKNITTLVSATKKEPAMISTKARLVMKSPVRKAERTGVNAGLANRADSGEKSSTAFLIAKTSGVAIRGTATGYQL